MSPSERASELQEKIRDYFEAGTLEIWVIDPKRRTIVMHAVGAGTRPFSVGQTFDGGEMFPGFQMAVAELFEGIAP